MPPLVFIVLLKDVTQCKELELAEKTNNFGQKLIGNKTKFFISLKLQLAGMSSKSVVKSLSSCR